MVVDEPSLILFGGAFDPPHAGHRLCIRSALNYFSHARIMIVPSYSPPGLLKVAKKCVASFADRVHLCQLAFLSEFKSGQVAVSEVEANLPSPSYTVQTLERIREDFPQETLALLMGFDQLRDFIHWKSPEKILALSSIVVMARGINHPQEQLAQGFLESKGIHLEWLNHGFIAKVQPFGTAIYFLNNDRIEVSSTEVRDRLRSNQEIPKGWLPEAVEKYIHQKNLYQND